MFDFLIGYVMGERAAARAAGFARGAAASAASQTTGDLADLDARIDRLLLAVDAMWTLLKEEGYTDEQLAERIRQLDSEDGILDGRRTPQPTRCRNCEAMVEAGRDACAFCGEPARGDDPGPITTI